MTKPTSRRKALAVVASSLATFSLGMMVAVSVAGSASAASPKKAKSPATDFFVINGTVNAASDHAVLASSAFPNFTTGAVDNYYAMAHSHVDNSPFAEGTASPADTGPIGQTAAAGNFQQPQYADARWPGEPGSGKATYGNQGGPYAAAHASRYNATAEASEASNALSAPSRPGTIALPKELDDRLKLALAAWKATWQDRLSPKTPVAPTPAPAPTPPVVPAPKTPPVPAPKPPVITTPAPPVAGGQTSPPVTVPLPPVPRTSARQTTTPSRSLASLSTPGDGMSSLESSTLATFDRKAGALVLEGESRLGRVSLGGGQIEIKGIHVSASIANDGSPTYKVAVSIAAASIGGVPVTIDQDGVHVAGQGQGLPYQQASDALNGALKQAGIQLFLVAPEVTKSSCDQTGTGTGTNTSTTTTSTSSDQSGTTSSCGQSNTTATCDQTGTGTGHGHEHKHEHEHGHHDDNANANANTSAASERPVRHDHHAELVRWHGDDNKHAELVRCNRHGDRHDDDLEQFDRNDHDEQRGPSSRHDHDHDDELERSDGRGHRHRELGRGDREGHRIARRVHPAGPVGSSRPERRAHPR